jgi:hypothetical protein
MSTVIGMVVIYYWGIFCMYMCGPGKADMFCVCLGVYLVRIGELMEKLGVKCQMKVEIENLRYKSENAVPAEVYTGAIDSKGKWR